MNLSEMIYKRKYCRSFTGAPVADEMLEMLKALSEISDREDPRLEPARLAPSSVNSQPWYFTHEGNVIHAYCAHKGILKSALSEMNRIDMGIALAHLCAAHPDSFRFFQTDRAMKRKGYGYIGSVEL